MKSSIELTNQFAKEGSVSFYKKEELNIIRIQNMHAQLDLSLYGAQVLSYIPTNEENLLWMSQNSEYKHGKAIRGGIPLCFPWFGPHESDSSLPQHGFARLSLWNLEKVTHNDDDTTHLSLSLKSSATTKEYWPHDFYSELTVKVGEQLEVSLMTRNTGSNKFKFTSALHSYIKVNDINKLSIEGLKDTSYYWGFEGTTKTQTESLLRITEEENRRYINTKTPCILNNLGTGKKIVIDKSGSQTSVVWNPWKENCKQMKDMPDDGYKSFICVEAANFYDDYIELQAENQHTISTTIRQQ